MRRTASEILNELENRIARLEGRTASKQIKNHANIPAISALLNHLGTDMDDPNIYMISEENNQVGILFHNKVQGKNAWFVKKLGGTALLKQHKGDNYAIFATK